MSMQPVLKRMLRRQLQRGKLFYATQSGAALGNQATTIDSHYFRHGKNPEIFRSALHAASSSSPDALLMPKFINREQVPRRSSNGASTAVRPRASQASDTCPLAFGLAASLAGAAAAISWGVGGGGSVAEAEASAPVDPEPPPGGGGEGRQGRDDGARAQGAGSSVEDAVQHARRCLQARVAQLEERGRPFPKSSISAKGQQVSVQFIVEPSCDISHLMVDIVARLGRNGQSSYSFGEGGSGVVIRAWDSAIARHLIMTIPGEAKQETAPPGDGEDLHVVFFWPLISGEKQRPMVEFLKRGRLTARELDAITSTIALGSGSAMGREVPVQSEPLDSHPPERREGRAVEGRIPGKFGRPESHSGRGGGETGRSPGNGEGWGGVVERLQGMGVRVYGLDQAVGEKGGGGGGGGEGGGRGGGVKITWEDIAGYEEQKREIEDTVLLALQCPEVYDSIAQGTRRKFESNRPRAILFDGPPGTGKTSCARVISGQSGVPLLYVPLDAIMSKYYGESEKTLSSIFQAGKEFPQGAIVFLDEIDALATSRDTSMHEATRRILAVLLREMDGFEKDSKVVVIAATNRKQDLDPALLSRFDASITFDLPNESTRGSIAAQYARHLSEPEISTFSSASEGMSGRDIRDVCEQAERHWASKLIRGRAGTPLAFGLPPVEEYLDSVERRKRSMHTRSDQPRPRQRSERGFPSDHHLKLA